MRGTFGVVGFALAVSAILGYPRPSAATLSGTQLVLLVVQALGSSAVIVQSGRRLSRRFLGALLTASVACVPATLAALLVNEWFTHAETQASWGHLLTASLELALVETVPVAYLLWRVRQWQEEKAGPAS